MLYKIIVLTVVALTTAVLAAKAEDRGVGHPLGGFERHEVAPVPRHDEGFGRFEPRHHHGPHGPYIIGDPCWALSETLPPVPVYICVDD